MAVHDSDTSCGEGVVGDHVENAGLEREHFCVLDCTNFVTGIEKRMRSGC